MGELGKLSAFIIYVLHRQCSFFSLSLRYSISCAVLSLFYTGRFKFEDPMLDTSGRLTLKRKIKL